MKYNFDEIVDRRNTNSIKYDFAVERGKPADVLPLWVGDMDFQTAPCIIDKLADKVQYGIFGYTDTKDAYFQAVHNWYKERFNWHVEEKWLVKTPGIVFAIATAIRALTNEQDAVLIQPPVYYPFARTVEINNRKLINNDLIYDNGKYHIDFEDFEKKIVNHNVKLFILCSPHNPVCRVWTKGELTRLGDICVRHGVLIVSDEIHSDFVFGDYKHFVLSDIKQEFNEITITCTAPSKTFNLAGLQTSNIFIANKAIRNKFKAEIERTGTSQLNMMGLFACQAAYEEGADWLEALKVYLVENIQFIRDYLQKHLPKVKLIEPQATFFVWLDFKELGIDAQELDDLIVNKAKLWLNSGIIFGRCGEGFQRINIACPRKVLEQALEQLTDTLNQRL